MLKKIRPINIFIFIWGLILLGITQFYREYTRYYLYLSILVIIPITILNLIKLKKQDKLNGTNEFQAGILRMGVLSVVLIVFYFLTKQDHI